MEAQHGPQFDEKPSNFVMVCCHVQGLQVRLRAVRLIANSGPCWRRAASSDPMRTGWAQRRRGLSRRGCACRTCASTCWTRSAHMPACSGLHPGAHQLSACSDPCLYVMSTVCRRVFTSSLPCVLHDACREQIMPTCCIMTIENLSDPHQYCKCSRDCLADFWHRSQSSVQDCCPAYYSVSVVSCSRLWAAQQRVLPISETSYRTLIKDAMLHTGRLRAHSRLRRRWFCSTTSSTRTAH